jgi:hypothetical protein
VLRGYISELVVHSEAPELDVDGLVMAEIGGYHLDLHIFGGDRSEAHEHRSEDCDELTWLAAQLIADRLDPFAFVAATERYEGGPPLRRPRSPEPEVPGEQEPPSTRPEPEPEPSAEGKVATPRFVVHGWVAEPVKGRRARRPSVFAVFALDATSSQGLFPGVGGGGRASLAVDVGRARVLAAGSAWLGPGFVGRGNEMYPIVGGQLGAWSVELGGCGLPGWRRLYFPLCARAGGGAFIGSGTGLPEPRTGQQPWAWLGLDVGLEWWLRPRFALQLGVAAAGSVLRPRFFIEGAGFGYVIGSVFTRLHAGVALRFGRNVRKSRIRGRGRAKKREHYELE